MVLPVWLPWPPWPAAHALSVRRRYPTADRDAQLELRILHLMPYRALADLVLVAHFGFVVFVALGGLLVLRWPRLVWLHIPAALWGVIVEYAGIICPLTPWEIALRQRAGAPTYQGDFIGHYLTAALYPAGLTRGIQLALGTVALAVNVVIYWRLYARRYQYTA